MFPMETSAVTNDNMAVSKVKLGCQTCPAPRSIGKRSNSVTSHCWLQNSSGLQNTHARDDLHGKIFGLPERYCVGHGHC